MSDKTSEEELSEAIKHIANKLNSVQNSDDYYKEFESIHEKLDKLTNDVESNKDNLDDRETSYKLLEEKVTTLSHRVDLVEGDIESLEKLSRETMSSKYKLVENIVILIFGGLMTTLFEHIIR